MGANVIKLFFGETDIEGFAEHVGRVEKQKTVETVVKCPRPDSLRQQSFSFYTHDFLNIDGRIDLLTHCQNFHWVCETRADSSTHKRAQGNALIFSLLKLPIIPEPRHEELIDGQ